MEPRSVITNRVIAPPSARGAHQREWPEVEATVRVTVHNFEAWGITSVTHEVVARSVVDIREGFTREALDTAYRAAHQRARHYADRIAEGHPTP